MKKIIKFSKGFLPCWIISGLIIAFGVVGIITKGINFGIDFKPGLVEEVRIAPPAMERSYSGSATVSVNTSSTALEFVISGIGADNETRTFTYGQNPTINDMAAAINKIYGLNPAVPASGSSASSGVYTNRAVSSTLPQTPMLIYA